MKNLLRAAAVTGVAAAVGTAVERTMIAAPHYHGPLTDHFDGRRFQNLDPGWQTERSFLRWRLTRKPGVWREWTDAEPGPAPPERVRGKKLRVTFVNHSTTLIQMDGVNILTDPIWSDRASPFSFLGPKRHRPPGIRFDDLPPLDAVLVSHNHYDHLDIPTLAALQRRDRRHRIFTPLGNGALLRQHDIGNAGDMDWWDTIAIDDRVRVTLVPARHFCARGLSDRNANLWGGFVISGPSGNVYFAGDTGWGKHFERIAAKFAPIRCALLPIGAYLPRWFMRPAHIDPPEAVEAHFVLGAKSSIAIHFGTFDLGDDGEDEPLGDLRLAIKANGNPRFHILDFGEGRELP